MENVRLLLLEDEISVGEIFVEVLAREGFDVSWFLRAELPAKGTLQLIDINGRRHPLDGDNYDVAALDGRLKGSPIEWGSELVPHIIGAGVPVVAFSGHPDLNREMVALGAVGDTTKLHWWGPPPGHPHPREVFRRAAKKRC